MTKVEKLREEIDDTLEDTANSLSPSRHKDFIGLDDVLDSLITASREEGAEQERERIVQPGIAVNVFDKVTGANEYGAWSEHKVNGNPEPRGSFMCQVPAGKYVFIPASVLSPAPKEEK